MLERVKPNGCKSEVYVRGLGGLQIDIAMLCEQDDSRGATFSVADLRTQLAKIRNQRPDKTFKLAFSQALAGLVRRGHLCWADDEGQRVKRGPVEPKLPRLTKEEERRF